MSRPCVNDHLPSPETCRICWWLAQPTEEGQRHRNFWGPDDSVAMIKPPCVSRGALVPLTERYKYNLGTLRDWYTCKKGYGSTGPGSIFCSPCQGCNPNCFGYVAAKAGDTVPCPNCSTHMSYESTCTKCGHQFDLMCSCEYCTRTVSKDNV